MTEPPDRPAGPGGADDGTWPEDEVRQVEHDPGGLDLARQIARSVQAASSGVRPRRRPTRRPTDPQSSGAHPGGRDPELVGAALADLALALRRDLPAPLDVHVQRWGGGLPQYAVGHLARVAAARAALAQVPGVEACGAAYDGVGIPACIASARRAAAHAVAGQ